MCFNNVNGTSGAWITIKALDPTAKVAPYGVTGSAAGREMAENVWDAYITQYGEPMPVDFYPLHWYPWLATWDGSHLAAEIAMLEAHIAWFESFRGIKWDGPSPLPQLVACLILHLD